MKKLLSFAALLIAFAGMAAAQDYDFSAVAPSGQTLYYKITSSTAPYTAGVVQNSVDLPSGNLEIPSTVSHNSIAYSVTSIGDYAFNACVSLTTVIIPNSVTSIGVNAFDYCSGIESISVNEGNPAYDSRNNCNAIIETSTNTLISGCQNTVIPNTVTSIGEAAFVGCYHLTNITIPNSVTSIGDGAFVNCTGLISLTSLAATAPLLGLSAFDGVPSTIPVNSPCGSLASYQAAWGDYFTNFVEQGCPIDSSRALYYAVNEDGNSVSVYGDPAEGRFAVPQSGDSVHVIIPDSVTYNNNSFRVTKIGNAAFTNHGQIISVTIPGSVTSIGDFTFNACASLTNVTIPNTVTSIGFEAFFGCTGLTSVTIPSSVTSIGMNAFGECIGIESMSLHEGNTAFDSRNNCNAIIETSTNMLISGCKNTVIPSTVTSIGEAAFYGCNGLTSITIPNSVTNIGINAFYGCTGLTSLTSQAATLPSLGLSAFDGVPSTIPVNIPCGSLASYQAAWGDYFTNFVDTCAGTSWAQVRQNVPTQGLMAYYPFDGNANDYSGNGNHGILGGNNSVPVLAEDRNGNAAGCYEFGGPDNPNWIKVTNSESLQLDTAISVSFWAQECQSYGMTGWGSLSDHGYGKAIVVKGGDGISTPCGLRVTIGRNDTGAFLSSMGCGGNGCNQDYYIDPTNSSYELCDWVHCVMVAAGNRMSIYNNGVLLKDTIFPNNINFDETNQQDMMIGIYSGEYWYPHLGKIDDVAIYNRPLTESEIAMLYNGTVTYCDTLVIHDTTYVAVHDTTIVNNYIHDTIYVAVHDTTIVNNYVHDTTIVTQHHYVHDTTYINNYVHDTMIAYINQEVHDTTYINHYIHDTSFINTYVHDTTYVYNNIHDTAYLTHYIHDTAIVNNYIHDTLYLTQWMYEYIHDTLIQYVNNYIHDTTFINNYIHDTAYVDRYIDNYIHDTVMQFINQYVHDTAYVNNYIHDTSYLTVHDTTFINNYIHDTVVSYVNQYVHDTSFVYNYIHDTAWLTQYVIDTTYIDRWHYDTAYVDRWHYDTAYVNHYIHDTAYVNTYVHDTSYLPHYIYDTTIVYEYVYDTIVQMRDINYYDLDVRSVQQSGIAVGAGRYSDSTVVEIAAIPIRGYRFMRWNDGSEENPRHVMMTRDQRYIAIFDVQDVGVTNVEAANITISADRADVTVQGAGRQTIRIYDSNGRLLVTQPDAAEIQTFRMPASGIYMVQVENWPAQRVVVVR